MQSIAACTVQCTWSSRICKSVHILVGQFSFDVQDNGKFLDLYLQRVDHISTVELGYTQTSKEYLCNQESGCQGSIKMNVCYCVPIKGCTVQVATRRDKYGRQM